MRTFIGGVRDPQALGLDDAGVEELQLEIDAGWAQLQQRALASGAH